MEYILCVNGLTAAYLKEFGCDCGRCLDATRQANTSVSVIGLEDGETAVHLLFDVGAGVTESLLSNPYLRGRKARLDWLILTHWHPDHTLEMNRLVGSHHFVQADYGQTAERTRLWCRQGTAEWLQRYHDFEWQHMLEPHCSGEYLAPGHVLPALDLGLEGITITPVTVSHWGADKMASDKKLVRHCCSSYVLETAVSKTVLLWDIDPNNDWIEKPKNEAEATAVQKLCHADNLFVDVTVWHEIPNANHAAFETIQRYARVLSPQRTFLVHLSGHPDGIGNPGWGWTDAQWQVEAQKVWAQLELPGQVFVPHIGQILPTL
jgi:ribonuclease BN (tRNA processing enzyme)